MVSRRMSHSCRRFGRPESMGTQEFRCLVGACGVALIVATQTAAAGPSEDARSSVEPAQVSVPPGNESASPTRSRQAIQSTPQNQTRGKERRKGVATNSDANGKSDTKLLQRQPGFGPLSIGVETDRAVKQRSLSGGEADPDRDLSIGSPHQRSLPSFLGLSLKSQFSW